MNILLGFTPFLAVAVLGGMLGAIGALIVGTAAAAALVVRGRLNGASPKVLEIGTLVLFAALAIYAVAAGHDFTIIQLRLCVDSGLLLVVLASMAARRPFTLQYAREQVPQALWGNVRFIRTNYVITAGWAMAFLVMVLAEAALLFLPGLPKTIGLAAIGAALLGAVAFTNWYAKRSQATARAGGT